MSDATYLEMGKATRPEIEAFVARCPVAIVPMGSTEQHGPHLPTATDTIIAEAIALRTARKSQGLVLPAQPLGYAWVWKGVPASLTMNFDSYVKMVHDTAESLASWGVKASRWRRAARRPSTFCASACGSTGCRWPCRLWW